VAVHLAAVADPADYGPYLSFRLFVVVLIGGPLTALGPPLGMLVLGLLSLAADALGSLEGVSAARTHTLLTSILLLAVVSLGWEGILRPARRRGRSSGDRAPASRARASLTAAGLQERDGGGGAGREGSVDGGGGRMSAVE